VSWLHTDTLLAATVFVGGIALSLFPHQEPRFLLPLLVPSFALLSALPFSSWSRMRRAWVVLNALLFVFWGVLHQGALLPALYSLSSDSSACAIAVAGTYSAPAVAVAHCPAIGHCSSVPVHSLEGSPVLNIDSFLQESLQRQCVYMVAPYSHPVCVQPQQQRACCASHPPARRWTRSAVLSACPSPSVFWWPHISTECVCSVARALFETKQLEVVHASLMQISAQHA
jgi:hypothetical protein